MDDKTKLRMIKKMLERIKTYGSTTVIELADLAIELLDEEEMEG